MLNNIFLPVIPAQAEIHYYGRVIGLVDSRLRGNDGSICGKKG